MGTIIADLPEVYAFFAGRINGDSVARVANGFTMASAHNVKHLHMMFHSNGGSVSDGIALYSLFRAAPFDVTLYNPGLVSSIAVIAYLGAKHRKTSAHAGFMIHRAQCPISQGTSADRAQTIVNATILDDQRIETILREHITMPHEQWVQFYREDLALSASDAVKFGIAHEVGDFSPPHGTAIFNL